MALPSSIEPPAYSHVPLYPLQESTEKGPNRNWMSTLSLGLVGSKPSGDAREHGLTRRGAADSNIKEGPLKGSPTKECEEAVDEILKYVHSE